MRLVGEVCDGRRGLNRVQYAFKEKEIGYGGWSKAQMGIERSAEVKQSLRDG